MFNPSRDQVRQFFFDVWAKYRAGQPLTGAEQPALDAVLAHPEYHDLLDQPDRYIERDYQPESGETNPFLRWESREIQDNLRKIFPNLASDPVSVFAKIRELKDQF